MWPSWQHFAVPYPQVIAASHQCHTLVTLAPFVPAKHHTLVTRTFSRRSSFRSSVPAQWWTIFWLVDSGLSQGLMLVTQTIVVFLGSRSGFYYPFSLFLAIPHSQKCESGDSGNCCPGTTSKAFLLAPNTICFGSASELGTVCFWTVSETGTSVNFWPGIAVEAVEAWTLLEAGYSGHFCPFRVSKAAHDVPFCPWTLSKAYHSENSVLGQCKKLVNPAPSGLQQCQKPVA